MDVCLATIRPGENKIFEIQDFESVFFCKKVISDSVVSNSQFFVYYFDKH